MKKIVKEKIFYETIAIIVGIVLGVYFIVISNQNIGIISGGIGFLIGAVIIFFAILFDQGK